MRKILILLVFLASTSLLKAGGGHSTSTLNGQVQDREGNPIVGAKVILNSTQEEVYTDFDGNFSFKNATQNEQKLTVSYVSFEEKTLVVNPKEVDQSEIKIALNSK